MVQTLASRLHQPRSASDLYGSFQFPEAEVSAVRPKCFARAFLPPGNGRLDLTCENMWLPRCPADCATAQALQDDLRYVY